MTEAYFLDTNIVSKMIQPKPDKDTLLKIRELIQEGKSIYLSPVVYYELMRGLVKKGASRQIERLAETIKQFDYIELTKDMWDAAVHIWVKKEKSGLQGPNDADILLVAQAEQTGAMVITLDQPLHRLVPELVVKWGG